jgi:hypothetical protein
MSTYKFTKAIPNIHGEIFGIKYTQDCNYLSHSVNGKWISPPHRLGRWVLDTDKDILIRQSMTKVEYYTRVTSAQQEQEAPSPR